MSEANRNDWSAANTDSELGSQYLNFNQLPVKFSKVHLRLLEKKNLFPKRIFLSPRKVVWDATECREWMERRNAERGQR
jgi:predicted DNA-binding transcriptional regulator AlpA